jgi:hypothetical protein
MTENLRLIPMLLALAASPLAHARLHSNDVASDAVKSPLRNALAEGFAKQETSFDLALKFSGHAANTGFHAPWAIDAMLPHFALRSGAENPGLKDANGESSIPYALAENESDWATDYLADADERHELPRLSMARFCLGLRGLRGWLASGGAGTVHNRVRARIPRPGGLAQAQEDFPAFALIGCDASLEGEDDPKQRSRIRTINDGSNS